MKKLWRKLTSPTARIIGSLWIIVGLTSGFVVSTSVRETSCEHQFRAALLARARINDESDALDVAQRKALADWIHDFSTPPVGADFYGQPRLDWLTGVSQRAIDRFNKLDEDRQKVIAARPPFPEITCGR